MRFFIDANLSEQLARGLREFGENVVHLKEHFSQNEQPPFAYRVPPHGTSIKSLQL